MTSHSCSIDLWLVHKYDVTSNSDYRLCSVCNERSVWVLLLAQGEIGINGSRDAPLLCFMGQPWWGFRHTLDTSSWTWSLVYAPNTFTIDCLTWKCAMICDRSPSSLPSPSPPNDMFSVRHVPTKKRPVPNPHSKIDSAPPTLMKSVSCEESMASEWSVLSKLPNLICSWYDRHTHYDRDDDVILGWALIGNSS